MGVHNTRWYPKYHVAAPENWINDPNGFCCFKSEYHLFYQFHPFGVNWGPMHWGHVISKDLVHWKHLPIALKPDEDYDRDGCFSGCGIEKDGSLYIFYTGHMHTPETAELGFDYVQVQCFAVSEDGVNFKKYPDNAIVLVPETEQVHGGDFRDPKVWKHGDKYYMVVGSRTPDKLLGQVLLYESDDIIHWNFKSIMSRAEGNQGSMWECPNFATIDGKDVLIFSPQDVKREINSYLNVYQSGYFIGKLDYKTGIYTHGEFELLDYGSDFYAPQITQLPDGRTIMIAWLDMWNNPMPEQADGWAGMMTVPRELHVRDGKVYSTPIKELESLRVAETSYENQTFYEPKKFEGVSGDVGELIVDIDLKATEEFEIDLRSSAEEKTVLTYNAALGLFKVNRDKSGEGGKGERECPILPADKMKLQIFMDRSSIEIFINDGERVMSARIYPRDNAKDIVFVPTGGTFKIDSIKFYTLGEGIPQP